MLFYKAEGTITNSTATTSVDRRVRRAMARKILLKSEDFCRKLPENSTYFVAECAEGLLTLGIITTELSNVESTLGSFLDHLGYTLQDLAITELTFTGINKLLRQACHNGYLSDDEQIREYYGLDRVIDRHLDFGDNILEEISKEDLFQKAQHHLFDQTLTPELERIYETPPVFRFYGHPVHYMVQTDDPDTRREVCRLLLQALYDRKRLMSRRYSFLDVVPGREFSLAALESLYRVSSHGTVIIRYRSGINDEDSGYASGDREIAEGICKIVNRHRNQVLTVICFPHASKKIQSIFCENMQNIALVELCENLADAEQARTLLKTLAKEHHIRTDKKLFEKLEAGQGYPASELRAIFDDWYNAKLRSTIYPQYKNIHTTQKEVVKSAPKGTAYDELQSMIGLTEAKAVIQKALNYYKIQKLYEDRGIKRDNPAMHMVFTGNPGTAKTTTARLFARIMKDNGLLSRGQLVEVGRSDLVGKYVGWTAQMVKNKFQAAIGGVLFIDEAYSLVDGNSGSFGDEAINTIVQEMENHREDVVVIFAGYPKEMERFLQKNPGLRSRIAFHVPFADYTREELCQIAVLMAKTKGVSFDAEALEKLSDIFQTACKEPDFGNGRYVRNLLEQAKMNQASRLLELDFEDITTAAIQTLKASDLVVPEVRTVSRRAIGFAC